MTDRAARVLPKSASHMRSKAYWDRPRFQFNLYSAASFLHRLNARVDFVLPP